MSSEIWQFAAFLGAVAVVFVSWLNIIYLPGRTLEQRYDSGEGPREPEREASPRSSEEDPYHPDRDEATRSSSDRTR